MIFVIELQQLLIKLCVLYFIFCIKGIFFKYEKKCFIYKLIIKRRFMEWDLRWTE